MNYLDFHADTLTEIKKGSLQSNHNDIDLDRVQKFCSSYIQVFAVWMDHQKVRDKEKEFEQLYQRAIRFLKEADSRIELCLSFEDARSAMQKGKAAAFLSIEDISFLGRHVSRIRELGFRFAMLTWNYENEYAFGAVADQTKGLKPRGKELARQLVEEGILLDISHLSDAGAEDIFRLTERPVIASHSNVRDICGQPRNLRREHIAEIIRRQGIIGMNLFSHFVSGENPVTLTDLFRHMDYILEMGGENALVLGGDFDGCSGQFPEGITGVESMLFLREQMEKAGFEGRTIDRIFFENGYRFLKRNLKGELQ